MAESQSRQAASAAGRASGRRGTLPAETTSQVNTRSTALRQSARQLANRLGSTKPARNPSREDARPAAATLNPKVAGSIPARPTSKALERGTGPRPLTTRPTKFLASRRDASLVGDRICLRSPEDETRALAELLTEDCLRCECFYFARSKGCQIVATELDGASGTTSASKRLEHPCETLVAWARRA
jgi:hypothetical protein